ncbi:MAG: inositol monophosphatase [Paracoccaceae bacterium]
MPESDLSLLQRVAEAAGDVAAQYFGKPHKSWDKPNDAGPVTEADLAVNALFEQELQAARPDYGWLSEETEDSAARLKRSRVFVIDPIDGTRSFKDGSRTWAHSLAVVEDGVAIAGVVYLPMRDMMFTAAKGQGAMLNGQSLEVGAIGNLGEAEFLAVRSTQDQQHWRADPPQYRRAYRPSLAYRMALVAQGRFDGMITLRDAWEWDIAAGDIIQREAGAVSSDRTGAPLRFNNPHPAVKGVVSANPTLHGQVIDALA